MANRESFSGTIDRISNLPDHILCHILIFVPTKDAIRTSILSSRWRYLFSSMSILDFRDRVHDNTSDHFKDFVDRLLFSPNQVSLECFRTGWLFRDSDYVRLYGWICAVLRRDVKEIVLGSSKTIMFPIHLFTSRSLVTLKLYFCGDIIVPTNVRLSNLKTLHLGGFAFSKASASIFRLVSSCVALEELEIEPGETNEFEISEVDIDNPSLKTLVLDFKEFESDFPKGFSYAVKINAPNLLDFKYDDNVADRYTLSNMKSIEKAYISFNQPDDATYDVDRERGTTHLFQAIRNVRSLELHIHDPEKLLPTRREPVLAFPNLVEFEFQNFRYEGQGTMLRWLVEFLHCMPILQTLALHMPSPIQGFESLPETVPSCLSFRLKEIRFSYPQEGEHMLEWIGYFLNHASVLEKLVVDFRFSEHRSRLAEKLSELSSLPKKSKMCRIVTT